MIRAFHASLCMQIASAYMRFARNVTVPSARVDRLIDRAAKFMQAAVHPPHDLEPILKGWRVEPASDYAGQIAKFSEVVAPTAITCGECQPAGIYRLRIKGEMFGLPEGFGERLARCETVSLVIDSVGGDGRAAWALIDALKGRKVRVHVAGNAFSAAALVVQCGCHRTITKDGVVMIHSPIRAVIGNANALREAAARLDEETTKDVDLYCARTGQPRALVAQWFDGDDHWFTAQQALAHGLVDEITV
jgi:hypothetical protein